MVHLTRAEDTLIDENTAWPSLGRHKCTLPAVDDHGMERLSPSGPFHARIIRVCRKLTMATYAHRLCRYYYPTRPAILAAWRQTSRTTCPWIIHPFSTFALAWQCVMLITWAYVNVSRPLMLAFVAPQEKRLLDVHYALTMVCSGVLALNVLINSITGCYRGAGGRRVELDFPEVARRYLRTYFVFDVVDAVPVGALVYLSDTLPRWWLLVHWVQIARAASVMEYALNVGHLVRASGLHVRVACFVCFSLATAHWCVCIVYGLSYQAPGEGVWEKYVSATYKVVSHFFHGSCNIDGDEVVAMTLALVAGFVFRAAALGYLLRKLALYGKRTLSFEVFLADAARYVGAHKLAASVHQRIKLYMRHRYQGSYYDEDAITLEMSEHLLHEIALHGFGHFMCTMNLCKPLRRATIGEILVTLEPVFYHAGDVVFAANERCDALHFISYGKMAAYSASGVEAKHFEDGQMLCVLGYYLGAYVWTAVAIEPTEAFVWRRPHVEALARRHRDLAKELDRTFARGYERFMRDRHEQRVAHTSALNVAINLQLTQNRILEQRALRANAALAPSTCSPYRSRHHAEVFRTLMKINADQLDPIEVINTQSRGNIQFDAGAEAGKAERTEGEAGKDEA